MSAEHAQREPTMEEILASIRRIISEEDRPGEVLELQPTPPASPAPVEVKAAPPPEPPPRPAAPAAPEPVVAKAPPPPPVEAVEAPPPAARPIEEDIMIVERAPEPAPVAASAPAPRPVAAAAEPQPEWTPPMHNALVSDPVASKAAGALGKLMGSMMVSTGATLDDVVRELMKPMLKEWLDANLPQLVEAEVAKEIDRIRRMAR
jgi:cell pole-organizing protein PopZ